MLIFENNMANLRRRDFLKIGLGAGAAAVIKPKIASAGKNDLSVLENKLNEFGIFNGDKRKPFLDKFDYSKGKNRLLIGFEDKIWVNLDEKRDYINYSKYEYLYKTNKAPRNQLLYL